MHFYKLINSFQGGFAPGMFLSSYKTFLLEFGFYFSVLCVQKHVFLLAVKFKALHIYHLFS